MKNTPKNLAEMCVAWHRLVIDIDNMANSGEIDYMIRQGGPRLKKTIDTYRASVPENVQKVLDEEFKIEEKIAKYDQFLK